MKKRLTTKSREASCDLFRGSASSLLPPLSEYFQYHFPYLLTVGTRPFITGTTSFIFSLCIVGLWQGLGLGSWPSRIAPQAENDGRICRGIFVRRKSAERMRIVDFLLGAKSYP